MSPETNGLNSIGVILAANGEVYLKSDSGVRAVGPGAEVYQGEELVTGHGSNAEIRFADDTLLSQGADSSISLDDYIYDTGDESASSLLFKMSQGTFRMVTGKIAEQNPERFKVGTPLATIGIRGTTTVHEISPDGQEKHGVEEIHSGKALLVQSIDGSIRVIDSPQALVDIAASGQMSTVRAMSVQELSSFRDIAPQAIQQEQEIREEDQQNDEQQNEEQQDQQDQQNGETQENGEEGQAGEQQNAQDGGEQGEMQAGEIQQSAAQGGETGLQQLSGQGVLDAGVAAMVDGAVISGAEGFQEVVNAVALQYAEQAFDALVTGDFETLEQLLDKLDDIPTQEDILDLVEGIAAGTTEVPEGLENVTYTSSSGINYILGDATAGDTWTGTAETDYYDGQGGNDIIHGMESADGLRGGTGNDTIYGDCGDDTIDGGEGHDLIFGGHDNDSINGGAGDDMIYGDEGNDYIDGNDDNDFLCGGLGNDTLSGGSGDDYIYSGPGEDILIGGVGTDTVTFADQTPSNASNGVFVDLNTSYDGYGIGSLDGVVDYLIGFEVVVGTTGNDDIRGDSYNNTLIGGLGYDSLTGNGGTDYYFYTGTGEGGDIVNFAAGDKFAFASDSIYAGASVHIKDNYDGTSGIGSVTGEEFIYDTVNDRLWYDSNGTLAGGSELIATVTDSNVEITDSDIAFI
ncbi:FecR domain-containing protein [Maridesulfovibrio sp. FT414]|uniref:FecR domain-containing protein n=1 Tax=Maridesulfovibrio sp. FT414 TaxID=2979469 RepID=UPI003D803434